MKPTHLGTCDVRSRVRAAFTLIELLVVIAIIALLVAILLPSMCQARESARKALCSSNLRQFGTAYNTYATDFKDNIASFTWRRGQVYADGFSAAARDVDAAANQAADIVRRRAEEPLFPVPPNWIPHVKYSHLVMMDYLAARLPEKMVACPSDRTLLSWQSYADRVVANPDGLTPRPTSADPNLLTRLPFSSSYLLVPFAYAPDKRGSSDTIAPDTSNHNQMLVPMNVDLGQRKLAEVINPSGKTCMIDPFSRHVNCRTSAQWYAYEDSVAPVLFWDSSVRDVTTNKSRLGQNPNTLLEGGANVAYRPDLGWEPPTRNGAVFAIRNMRYFWTKGGLGGFDLGQ